MWLGAKDKANFATAFPFTTIPQNENETFHPARTHRLAHRCASRPTGRVAVHVGATLIHVGRLQASEHVDNARDIYCCHHTVTVHVAINRLIFLAQLASIMDGEVVHIGALRLVPGA